MQLPRKPGLPVFLAAVMAVLCSFTAQARPSGAISELIERRTAVSKHWQNADGSFTAEISPCPVHYKDSDGSWKDVDTTIGPPVKEGFAHSVVKNPLKVHLSGNARGWQALETGDCSVSFFADATSPTAGQVEDNTVKFSDAWPSTDLKYTVLPYGLKEELTLKSAPSVSEFRFSVKAVGLRLAQEGGTASFVDELGRSVVSVPEPFMRDASGRYSKDVGMTWQTAADGSISLVLTPDVAWLAEAQYPVVVDPTLQLSAYSAFCDQYGTDPNVSWFLGLDPLRAGRNDLDEDFGLVMTRAFAKWSISTSGIPTNATVTSATITLGSPSGSGLVGMKKVTSNWPGGTLPSMNSQNILTQQWSGTWSGTAVTSMVQDWVRTPSTAYGVEWHIDDQTNTMVTCSSSPTLAIDYTVDTTPPNPGTACSPIHSSTKPFAVTYSGAADEEGGSGLMKVELWYKKGYNGTWYNSWLYGTAASGSLNYNPPNISHAEDTYYFDLVAVDNAGNRSAAASGFGDDSTVYDKGVPASGSVRLEGAYLFPGGPLMSVSEYDAGGLLVRQGSIGYGPEGEVLSATGDTETVRFTYDGLYRVKSVKDGKNQTTSYDYDTNGNLTDVYYPGGDHIQYLSYDGAGNPLSVTDANGVTTTFSYGDPGGLLNRIQNATDTIQFSYDSYGRCDHESSGNETINRMFDHLGGVISESTTYAGLVPKTITYAHNPDGSLSTMQTPAGTYSYTYDEIGRITGLTNPLGQSFAWDYLDNNWLNSQTLKNSGGSVIAKTSYLFNPRGMLTGLINESGSGATLSQFTGSPRLAYDAVGNLLSVTAAIPAVPSLGGTTTYTYNNKDQLTYEQSTRSGGYAYNFAYDSAGNPTTFRGAGRTFNSNNQDTRFTYDLNGNPTGYKSHGLLFDDMDRMKSFDAAFDAAYGTSNLRAFTGPSGSRTYTLFSGGVPVCEMDSSGNVVSTNTFGPTGLLSRRTGATDSFYTFDPQGSVVQTLTGSGTVSATLAYDAYGNPLTGSQGAATPYGYGGQAGYYTDSQTGLILCTNRYYDPVEGRWLTRDPIGYAGGINLYAYCGNNPVNRVDPSGCRSVDDDDWQLVTTTAKYSGGGGLVRAAGVAFTDRYNNEYNADLQTIGLDDYACKNPIGSAALKHGSLTVGRMALDVATLGDTTALVEGGIGLLARPQTVYALFDEAGEVFYIGRSICPKIRELAHRLRFGRTFEMIYQAERLTYNEARGVEQYLIEMHGLEDVGLLRNRINSIREGTPYYNRWRNWGQDYIGLPQ